jgi:hypothetical protein
MFAVKLIVPFETVAPFIGLTTLMTGGTQLSYVNKTVFESVPQELLAFKTNVFKPGDKLTLVEKEPLFTTTLDNATPFCVICNCCPFETFETLPASVKEAWVTVKPLFAGDRIAITGG